MQIVRREFLHISAASASLLGFSQLVLAQAASPGPKLVQILRSDLQGQQQTVQETLVSFAEFGLGTAAPWHMHPGAQELLFVTEGELTVEVEGQGSKV